MGLSKFRKQFFNFNFLGGYFVTKTSLLFWNQFKILNFFDTLYDLIQAKKLSPLRRANFKIYQHKNQKNIETPQNKEKCLF
jgi:hypothetical protein